MTFIAQRAGAVMPGRSGWLAMWVATALLWTAVVAALGWINMPRAQHIPHDPGFLNRLSTEATSILAGDEPPARPSRWGLNLWPETRFMVHMPNGARLAFPQRTSRMRVALVRDEYLGVLQAEATTRAQPYVRGMIIVWLLPCPDLLILGLAGCLAFRSGGSRVPDTRPMAEVIRLVRSNMRRARASPLRLVGGTSWRRRPGANYKPRFPPGEETPCRLQM